MEQDNQPVGEKLEARMCPGCSRMQDHIIRRIERENRHYTIVEIEEVCTVCGGKRTVTDKARGNYKYRDY